MALPSLSINDSSGPFSTNLHPHHTLSSCAVDVYKLPPIGLQVSDLLVFPHACLYAGDFHCQHVGRGYDANCADGECLVGRACTNNLALLYNPKDAASFHSGRCNTSTSLVLTFVRIDLDGRLPDRRVLEKLPRSRH